MSWLLIIVVSCLGKSNQTPLILSNSQRGLQGPDGLPLSLTSNVSSYLQHHDLLYTPTILNSREITMQEAEAQTADFS